MRTAIEAKLARMGTPAARLSGEGAWKEIPNVDPAAASKLGKPGETSLYVHPDMYSEVRDALKVDRSFRIPYFTPAMGVFTRLNLLGLAEATQHTLNQATSMFLPGVSPQDAPYYFHKIAAGDIEIQRRLMELARMSAMKGRGLESMGNEPGILWGGKTDPTGFASRWLDTVGMAQRLMVEDAFDKMQAKGLIEGTETNKRDFINQALGQYNKTAQNMIVRLLRDSGIGPFATAVTQFNLNALKRLGGFDPGVKATSWQNALWLRANMGARILGLLATIPVWNLLRWGRADGDDDVPFLALKYGDDQETGESKYIDWIGKLTGIPRGLRMTGIMAYIEGTRRGDSSDKIINRAIGDVASSVAQPAAGPAPEFGYTAITGKKIGGYQVAEQATKKNQENQNLNNFLAALWNLVPPAAILAGKDKPGAEPWDWSKLAGAFAPKEKQTSAGQKRKEQQQLRKKVGLK